MKNESQKKRVFNIFTLFKYISLTILCLSVIYLVIVILAIKNDDSMLMENIVLSLLAAIPSMLLYFLMAFLDRVYNERYFKNK